MRDGGRTLVRLCACGCKGPLTPRGQRRAEVRFLHGHHWRAKSRAERSVPARRAYETRKRLYVMRGVAALRRKEDAGSI